MKSFTPLFFKALYSYSFDKYDVHELPIDLSNLIVVKDFGDSLKSPKTREVTEALKRLGIASADKVLIILSSPSDIVVRSVRNLEKVKLIASDQLNVFDLLHANSLVIGDTALLKIQEVYGND